MNKKNMIKTNMKKNYTRFWDNYAYPLKFLGVCPLSHILKLFWNDVAENCEFSMTIRIIVKIGYRYVRMTRIMTVNSNDFETLIAKLSSNDMDQYFFKRNGVTKIIINYHILSKRYDSFINPYKDIN